MKLVKLEEQFWNNEVTELSKTLSQSIDFRTEYVSDQEHDVVELGRVRSSSLQKLYENNTLFRHFIERPPFLRDFIAKCAVPGYDDYRVYYKIHEKGKWSFNARRMRCSDEEATMAVYYDAYILDTETSEVEAIVQLSKILDKERGKFIIHHRLVALSEELIPLLLLDKNQNGWAPYHTFCVITRALYTFIQDQFTNCPEQFIQRERQPNVLEQSHSLKTKEPSNHNSKRRSRQPVIHKVYTYQDADDKNTANNSVAESSKTETRTITCPYYTVRGHYRKYKSGKVVWIDSYPKGKDRNNPERIVAKDYIVKGEDFEPA